MENRLRQGERETGRERGLCNGENAAEGDEEVEAGG